MFYLGSTSSSQASSIDSLMKSSNENESDTLSENSDNVSNIMLSVSSEETNEYITEYSQDCCVLANYIREHFETSNIYVFRCVKIDGVYCCCVLYRDEKILNIESVRVLVKNDEGTPENYSLHFEYYDTIENAIELVNIIVTTYKLYNGDLYSPEDYAHLIAEEPFIPYSEKQRCPVCNTNTSDITSCGHYICFRCREQSIYLGTKNCPTCNKPNILHIYHNDANVINNFHYHDLVSAIQSEELDKEEDDALESYGPTEQLIAKQLHSFVLNNPGFINSIAEFIGIFNRFIGNP
uniref:RING-type domain-containing protein n=1 Tax=viral metagenome TaxID=1070528 RepID=A0A6C0K2L2_9ZZZZ